VRRYQQALKPFTLRDSFKVANLMNREAIQQVLAAFCMLDLFPLLWKPYC
jgi:hypothetical protein